MKTSTVFKLKRGHKMTTDKFQRGITPKSVLSRVMVPVVCMSSDDALYFYDDSWIYLERFPSYRADTILWQTETTKAKTICLCPFWGRDIKQQQQQKTSKLHREFMSPALFLFELLKTGKLTRGPLVLYHLPKYWSRKPVIKNNFRILKKPHAFLQTILKASVKFQKDWLKTVVGVTGTRYLLPICFCSIRTQNMSKLKMRKKW